MNYTREEKLALISELITLANTNKKLETAEIQFIKAIAATIQIDEVDVEKLVEKPVPSKVIKSEAERITQFHRLVLVMNIDQRTSVDEIVALKNFGLKMGLPAPAIDAVLQQMGNYENKVIPPQTLIDIFKKHYN